MAIPNAQSLQWHHKRLSYYFCRNISEMLNNIFISSWLNCFTLHLHCNILDLSSCMWLLFIIVPMYPGIAIGTMIWGSIPKIHLPPAGSQPRIIMNSTPAEQNKPDILKSSEETKKNSVERASKVTRWAPKEPHLVFFLDEDCSHRLIN